MKPTGDDSSFAITTQTPIAQSILISLEPILQAEVYLTH